MSYSTIAKNAVDVAFLNRLTSAVAAEGEQGPQQVAYQLVWAVAAHSDIEAAYASALAAGHPNPGGSEEVISDQMILSAVQAELPNLPETATTSS